MQIILNQPCNLISFLGLSSSLSFRTHAITHNCELSKAKSSDDAATCGVRILSSNFAGTFVRRYDFWSRRCTHISFCSNNGVSDDFSSTQTPEIAGSRGVRENEELWLLNKPNPVPITNGLSPEDEKELEKPDGDEILEPFLKFFKPKEESEEAGIDESELEGNPGERKERNSNSETEKETENFDVEYYDPKPGDFVIGVVVSGNENKLNVNIGADLLGTMLTKEILPLYNKEMDYLLCDLKHDAEEFMVHGKMGIVKDDDAIDNRKRGPGRPVVEAGNIIFAEVLGRTLSGRPLLSTRRYFRRIAWHRVRQIKQFDEPIEVRITEWNTGGLLTRIEGLRAFLPKAELVKKVNSFTELKEYVGCKLFVMITRINEDTNDIILSEKAAWEKLNLIEGTLLEGTIVKILPYGAQVKIGESNRSGLLHISNITRTRITLASDVLTVGEKVKVLVVKSLFPDKISLSIADLESKPGLFISNREKLFAEAEEMAKKYRQKLPTVSVNHKPDPPPISALSFDHEEGLYANWNWFKFEDSDNNEY